MKVAGPAAARLSEGAHHPRLGRTQPAPVGVPPGPMPRHAAPLAVPLVPRPAQAPGRGPTESWAAPLAAGAVPIPLARVSKIAPFESAVPGAGVLVHVCAGVAVPRIWTIIVIIVVVIVIAHFIINGIIIAPAWRPRVLQMTGFPGFRVV